MQTSVASWQCALIVVVHHQSTPSSADLFAILKTTEKLERAWTQDAISAADYELACTKLIAQFKTLWGTLRDTVSVYCRAPVRSASAHGSRMSPLRALLHVCNGQPEGALARISRPAHS